MSVGIDSKFKPGFPRWERARINALADPGSKAAKLYHARVTTAMEASEGFPPDRIFHFRHTGRNAPAVHFRCCSPFCAAMEYQLAVLRTRNPNEVADVLKAAFLGLVTAETGTDDAPTWIEAGWLAAPSKRPVKCRTCWRVISPNGVVSRRVESTPALEELWQKEKDLASKPSLTGVVQPTPVFEQLMAASSPEGELFVVDASGELTRLGDVRVVRLTPRERDALQLLSLSDKASVRSWAEQYALKFDA